jgi:hypothetical protein
MAACAKCEHGGELTFTGARWLCDRCWRAVFGVAPPVDGLLA